MSIEEPPVDEIAEVEEVKRSEAWVYLKALFALGLLYGILKIVLSIFALVVAAKEVGKLNRIRSRETCLSIPRYAYQTFLLYEAANRRSYYLRSECMQRLAVRDKDPALCNMVIERSSWLFDGSGVSPETCRALVEQVK